MLKLAQPIRYLLVYAGQEFEDKYYKCGPGYCLLTAPFLQKLDNMSNVKPDDIYTFIKNLNHDCFNLQLYFLTVHQVELSVLSFVIL
jgi:hypothetical protein